MGAHEVDERLAEFRLSLAHFRSAFLSIAEIARENGEGGVEFAALMLIESTDSFDASLLRYVEENTDATEER